MLKRILIAVLLCLPVKAVWAVDVAGIVACKTEGETWLCAAYENEKIQVFRSEHYISKVVFKGATEASEQALSAARPGAAEKMAPGMEMPPGAGAEDSLPAGRYTLQLLACNAPLCRDRMKQLGSIPGGQIVEIRNQGKLWEVLLVGGYQTRKSAEQAAAGLIKRYRLRDKPWVRSVESIRSRLVRG